jgi:tetratricopeptide (TPR) repeat protein
MRKLTPNIILIVIVAVVLIAAAALIVSHKLQPRIENILAAYDDKTQYGKLTITYPFNETLFPPEIVPSTFRWKDSSPASDTWLITMKFQDNEEHLNFLTRTQFWAPTSKQWETIKKHSLEKQSTVTILGLNRLDTRKILSAGQITIKTSKDLVGAPLFYREVNLPFIDAVKDPSYIRWRFGAISSPKQPPIVLEGLPVCGNCHSFSADGQILAMDVDYANSKGSYVITPVAGQMTLATSYIITWDDYRKKDGQLTFGLLSQISPNGRFVVSTVKDESVFVPMPALAFSQLFFPIKGILCIYDRQTKIFQSLPGADDPNYVQSNPNWSPDGKYIVFARTKAYDLKHTRGQGKVLLTREECKEFVEEGKSFTFDLYRIPFNDGKGGTPEPVEGASNNGMSNYFGRYSPDGKWLVFCKAKSYMLLQPDSELFIIPAQGGQARRLRCNTTRMNSWHSWSPNSRWLVFSSKTNSDYTQLFLTHIDDEGNSSPAVLLAHFTTPDKAANIPEFVNASPSAIKKIREQFLDDYSFLRAGNEFFKAGDADNAIPTYRKALELNPNNLDAHLKLGFLLYNVKEMYDEGMAHYQKALQLDPNNTDAHYNLGLAMSRQGKSDEAIKHWSIVVRIKPDHVEAHSNLGALLFEKGMLKDATAHLSEAVHLDPNNTNAQYNLGQAMFQQGKFNEAIRHWFEVVRLKPGDINVRYNLGMALVKQGKLDEAIKHWLEVVRLDPNDARSHYNLATALAAQGKIDDPLAHYSKAISLRPAIDKSPVLHDILAVNYAKAGRFREAIVSAQKALNLARTAGDNQLAQEIEQRIELYRQNRSVSDIVIKPQ